MGTLEEHLDNNSIEYVLIDWSSSSKKLGVLEGIRRKRPNLRMCLSCHDGNYATGAMMQNKVYETLPASYGTKNSIPTLLGNDGTTTGNYLNDHPVGLNAVMGCGGPYDWDCSIDGTGKVLMTGPNSAKFITNYGFFVSPKAYNNQPTVMLRTPD